MFPEEEPHTYRGFKKHSSFRSLFPSVFTRCPFESTIDTLHVTVSLTTRLPFDRLATPEGASNKSSPILLITSPLMLRMTTALFRNIVTAILSESIFAQDQGLDISSGASNVTALPFEPTTFSRLPIRSVTRSLSSVSRVMSLASLNRPTCFSYFGRLRICESSGFNTASSSTKLLLLWPSKRTTCAGLGTNLSLLDRTSPFEAALSL